MLFCRQTAPLTVFRPNIRCSITATTKSTIKRKELGNSLKWPVWEDRGKGWRSHTLTGVYLTTIPTAASVAYECNEYEAMVEWRWQGKTQRLREKPVPETPCPQQIPYGHKWDRTRAYVVKDRRLIVWTKPIRHRNKIENARIMYHWYAFA
jgi:hypothetical protein